jgi:hypothetical protein
MLAFDGLGCELVRTNRWQAMTVYTKTAAGMEAMKNPQTALPRRLRTLLICIDGKSSLQTYIKSLTAFGDVASLMDSLREAGLIEVLGQTDARSNASRTVAVAGIPISEVPGLDESFHLANARALTLRQAIAEMGDFVSTHLPDNAIEIVLMLDKVESVDELNQLMPSYTELIKPFGAKAALHLRQLAPITQNKFS